MKDIQALHRAEYEEEATVIATSPGVVKLLGEQAEAAEGLVLAVAIACEMRVAVSVRRDSSLRFFAPDLGERKRTSLSNMKFKREDRWANFPKAVLDLLFREGLAPRGVNFTILGEVPPLLGLASSTAITLASALALTRLFGLEKRNDEIADLARRAEEDFLGKPSGAHDILTGALATPDSVSIIDLRANRRRALPFFDGEWSVLLTDSKVPRFSVDTELKQRDDDCKRCLALIGKKKRSLRDVTPEEVDELMGVLPESVRRRCLHVAEEQRRVREAEDALASGDTAAFGRVINKSHLSLRNLYEVSCPEIDWLQKRAAEIEGVLCSRLTGKGFGGCTVSIMRSEIIPEYRRRLEDYERIFGFRPFIHETSISPGLRLVED
jgi:galactokinase